MSSPRVSFEVFENTINGKNRSGAVKTRALDPSTGSPLWEVPVASKEDLDEAVEAAKKAFPAWSRTTWAHRQEVIMKMRERLLEYLPEFTELLLKEAGKPTPFADYEVQASAEFLRFNASCELPSPVRQDDKDVIITERYVPIGVVGAICPWNFPLALSTAKVAAALVTGNCVIVKPSPFTPYSILKFAEIVQDIVPAGVFQTLNGDHTLGPQFAAHEGIGKISFTGSIATGKRVMETASKTLKKITLELGGNNATVVCDDVDVATVAPQVALGAFYNSGQLCVASKRIFVHESIHAEFVKAISDVVESWKTGPASVEGTMVGPVQNKQQFDIVQGFYDDCKKNGYKFATGESGASGNGFHFAPAIIDNPPDNARIVVEEPFGPIVPIQSWKDEDELLRRVNDTVTGLGGSVWSADPERALKIGHQIEAGTIWINSFETPIPQGHFCGHKQSGIGGEWGLHGLYSYCNVQVTQHYKQNVGKPKA